MNDERNERLRQRLRPGTDYHPLQVVPWFRRWPPSTLRNIVFTAILCAVVVAAIALFILGLGHRITWRLLGEVATFTVAIGYAQHFFYRLAIVSARRHPRAAPWLMHPFMLAAVLPVLAIATGYVLAGSLLRGGLWLDFSENWRGFVFSVCVTVGVGWLLWEATETARRREIERRERAELEAAVERAERQRATAELKTLRAQVEPHFLYNTLANVVSLIEHDPATAKHMTERLIGYLRNTLATSRRDRVTLGDELAIVGDYLEILRLRMGERLRYAIEADEATRALPFPPLLLQPLVENAIKHGLEPKIGGGTLRVRAQRRGELLDIEVSDTGLGFGADPATAGTGTGLSNVRERLRALHGEGARLVIEQQREGTLVRLLLPWPDAS